LAEKRIQVFIFRRMSSGQNVYVAKLEMSYLDSVFATSLLQVDHSSRSHLEHPLDRGQYVKHLDTSDLVSLELKSLMDFYYTVTQKANLTSC